MTTNQDIKLEYIHAISDVLLELTADEPRINTLIEIIHKESAQEENTL